MISGMSLLAKKLVDLKILTIEKAQQAEEEAKKAGIILVEYLIKAVLANSTQLSSIISQEFGIPYFDAAYMNFSLLPDISIKDFSLLRKFKIAPLYLRSNTLFVAITDPSTLGELEQFKQKIDSKISVEAIVIDFEKIVDLISCLEKKEMGNLADGGETAEVEVKTEIDATSEDNRPIIKFINKTLLDAISSGCSDIHFEPYEQVYRIRFRRDGILHEYASPAVNQGPALATRLKVMAQLDISERRVPQDGRFKLKIAEGTSMDFRLSTCPTLYGEKIVMRILDPANAKMGIDALGYSPWQKEQFLKAISCAQGMILVTGPTGSGKTVSLYTALNILNDPERNISTVEDPVEINVMGVNQVNINTKAGLLFSTALRAFLRQDPDVIMLGEIRDLETAEIAVKAAQTGHLVLSTLHTNSAPETLVRLINMGIPSYNLATSVILIVAQRLARRLCSLCKKIREGVTEQTKISMGFTAEEAAKITLYEPVGCSSCKNGYKGRVGLYEVMPISKEMRTIIMNGSNAILIAEQAQREGIVNIRGSGLEKVKEGITTIEELYRVS